MSDSHYDPALDSEEVVEDDVREPRWYKVLLHNDHYTTMDFVIYILMRVFSKTPEAAFQLMAYVHEHGVGICGVYSFDVAETKVDTVHALAQENGFPLRCSLEEDE